MTTSKMLATLSTLGERPEHAARSGMMGGVVGETRSPRPRHPSSLTNLWVEVDGEMVQVVLGAQVDPSEADTADM